MSTDPKQAAVLLLSGKAALADVVGVTDEDLTELRVTAGELLRKGMFDECTELVNALVALGDEHPLLPFLRAECEERQGDLHKAQETLRAAIEHARGFELGDMVEEAEAHLARLEAAVGTPEDVSDPP